LSYDICEDKKEIVTVNLDNIKRQLIDDQEKNFQEKQKQSKIDNNNNNNNNNKLNVDDQDFKSQIHNNEFYEYIVKTVKKTVKSEDALIRQILYTAFSAYIEDDPLNLGVLAPTSEGKTYPITESLQYFPNEDILYIGQMSTMTLVRQKGIIIDQNGKPIKERLQELRKNIRELAKKKKESNDDEEKTRINEEIEKFNEEIPKLYEESRTLIDLRGKILVFLEPPKHELWNLIKPILSHDKKEIEFPFVNKTDNEGHQTKKVVVRGWPACIFCSAKDESKWDIWPEIKSRILTTSPNMNPQKYKESIELISLKAGEPNLIQQNVLISDQEIETTKDCVLFIIQKIRELKSKNKDKKISTWIPYRRLLEKELPSNKGTDMRFAKRVYALLNIVPIVKHNLRKILVLGGESSVIAGLDDLREVLSITQNFEGIPKYKIEFFNNIFYPLFISKNKIPDESKDGSKIEDMPAVTARQLCNKYKEIMSKTISIDILKKTYLNELNNNGIIDYDTSKIDAKQYIYYPIVEPSSFENNDEKNSLSLLSKSTHFDNISQLSLSIYEKVIKNINEIWIFSEITKKLCYRNDLTNITGPLADYLNNHQGLQIWDNSIVISSGLRQQHREENDKNNIKNNCCSCNSIEDRKGKLTISEFAKKYIEKPIINFDIKVGSNIAHFGKISPILSKLSNFDNKDINNKNFVDDKHNQSIVLKPESSSTLYQSVLTNDVYRKEIDEGQTTINANELIIYNNIELDELKSTVTLSFYKDVLSVLEKIKDPQLRHLIIYNAKNIKRSYPSSDRYVCFDKCSYNDDKWFMLKHPCKNFYKQKKQKDNISKL
jgi:hypothetical protein